MSCCQHKITYQLSVVLQSSFVLYRYKKLKPRLWYTIVNGTCYINTWYINIKLQTSNYVLDNHWTIHNRFNLIYHAPSPLMVEFLTFKSLVSDHTRCGGKICGETGQVMFYHTMRFRRMRQDKIIIYLFTNYSSYLCYRSLW